MKLLITFVIICSQSLVSYANEYETNIIFRTFNANGVEFNSTFDDNVTLLANCQPADNYTIIAHGWTESINSIWPRSLIAEFLKARAGCVFFMDYYKLGYAALVSRFDEIQAVLTRKLQQLDEIGFDPTNAYMFGFSFGSHLVFESAYQYGPKKVARADCCDPAGPSFPASAASVKHAKDAAQTVQCIHTSSDKGTTLRYCQKDINMGKCGLSQIGATSPPLMSHGLCPMFYTFSFNNQFGLVPKETVNSAYNTKCVNKTIVPDVTALTPTQMGFKLDTSVPDGEYYSLTGVASPFNLI